MSGRRVTLPRGWPVERVLFAMAGSVTVAAALLSAVVSPWFLLLAAFVGINQWLFVAFGACPASIVLSRACEMRSSPHDADSTQKKQAVTGA